LTQTREDNLSIETKSHLIQCKIITHQVYNKISLTARSTHGQDKTDGLIMFLEHS